MNTRERASRPVLLVDGLRIRRGENVILAGLTWRVERGEHWIILGANGSGKTSLLSALTAYLSPSAGTVEVLGVVYGRSDWRELRKRVGLVSSSVRQMIGDDATALEVIISGKEAMINLWGNVAPADRRRGLQILRQVEGMPLADRPWRVLSQGERQRVLIGRALMAAPELLILDEPCAGLDPLAREHFMQFVERLGCRRSAPTLVFVTHHVEEITPVFTHALVLRSGHAEACGPLGKALTSAILTRAFGAPVRLQKDRFGKFRLTVSHSGSRVM